MFSSDIKTIEKCKNLINENKYAAQELKDKVGEAYDSLRTQAPNLIKSLRENHIGVTELIEVCKEI